MIWRLSLLLFLTLAVWMDFKKGIIRNWLIVSGILVGLFFQVHLRGSYGILYFLVNVSVPVVLFFYLFHIRGIGAGDLKLLSLVGSFYRTHSFFDVLLYIFFAAFFCCLYQLYKNETLTDSINRFMEYVDASVEAKRILPYPDSGTFQNKLHFSLPILLGVFLREVIF